MKNRIKLTLIVIICIAQFSCKNEDSKNINTSLIGEWLRNDFTETHEYQLHFEENDFGKIVNQVTSKQGVISSADAFNWTITDNILTVTLDDDTEIITTVEFLVDGNLILANFSDLEFTRQ